MVALGDLFAPAYNKSQPASVQAVQDWQNRNYGVTNPIVEQSRTPVSFNTGNPAGMVDVEALRALAQGGPYDIQARRDAIAQQVAANQAAAAQQQQQSLGTPNPAFDFAAANAYSQQAAANRAAAQAAQPANSPYQSPDPYQSFDIPGATYYTPAGSVGATSGFVPYSPVNQMPLSYANGGNYPGS